MEAMIMKINLKKIFPFGEQESSTTPSEDEYYNLTNEESSVEGGEGSKLMLLEPRAYSESQQIADHLKNRHTVVVNLKRVTTDQAKRIVDFLSGTVYAIGGDLQKIGGGIFLCTPKNINVQGKITGDEDKEKIHDNSDIEIDW
jgi:cell division inhibitor SepF